MIEGLKIPTIGSMIRFVIMWIIVAFIVKLVVPADWRQKLFGIN
jgi:hypothetical protein